MYLLKDEIDMRLTINCDFKFHFHFHFFLDHCDVPQKIGFIKLVSLEGAPYTVRVPQDENMDLHKFAPGKCVAKL